MFDNLDKLLLISCNGTMWKSMRDQPIKEKHEIIELAYSFLDLKSLEASVGSYIIKPKKSSISKFCKKMTGLSQEDVDKGISFEDACRDLLTDKFSTDFVYAGWGIYDRKQIKEQCKESKIPYPFSGTYMNLQLYHSIFSGSCKEVYLDSALKQMDKSKEFNCRRAINRVENLTALTKFIMQKVR